MSKPATGQHNHGWIGVDLDGTLAHYTGWIGETIIGVPVPAMAARVRRWLALGMDVRIVTARATRPEGVAAVQAWALEHFGVELQVTCCKDYAMVQLWDDRAIQVEPNTGRRVDGQEDML